MFEICICLISLGVSAFATYLVRNSHKEESEELIKFPLYAWFTGIIVILIPIVNLCLSALYLFLVINKICTGDLELDEDFWLTKKY